MSLSIPKPSLVSDSTTSSRPIAIFSDFDGTIFHQDTGHILFDNFGCGKAKREELDGSIGDSRSFREASEEMWGSLNVSLDDGLKSLSKNLVIDEGFQGFLEFCDEHKIPFNVISAGLKPLLRGALDHFLGPQKSSKIGIVSNDGQISHSGDSWKPIWRHDTELGHDKALSIKEFRQSVVDKGDEQPLLVFIGDGVSDLAAASQADVLFARKGLKLEKYCIEHKIPYIPYDSFKDIKIELEDLVRGNQIHDTSSFMRPASLSVSDAETSETGTPGDDTHPPSPSTPSESTSLKPLTPMVAEPQQQSSSSATATEKPRSITGAPSNGASAAGSATGGGSTSAVSTTPSATPGDLDVSVYSGIAYVN